MTISVFDFHLFFPTEDNKEFYSFRFFFLIQKNPFSAFSLGHSHGNGVDSTLCNVAIQRI